MYVIAFGQVGPAKDFQNPDGTVNAATAVPFTCISPTVGEQFKFRPNGNGSHIALPAPGTYLIMGVMESGRTDRGVVWRRVSGTALAMSLGDGETAINRILAQVSGVSAKK